MSRIVWDNVGDRLYETGVRMGVLYPQSEDGDYPSGEAWNGLVSVTESPSGAEPSPLYADDIKYLTLMSIEEFGGTIEAFMYPDSFMACDGTKALADGVYAGQQPRQSFGLSYRTVLGNDILGEAYGYKLHLVYGATASPSEKAYQTINETPEANTFSWEFTTIPVQVAEGFKPTAVITIDSTKVPEDKLLSLENILYGATGPGGSSEMARLPLPSEIASLFDTSAQ